MGSGKRDFPLPAWERGDFSIDLGGKCGVQESDHHVGGPGILDVLFEGGRAEQGRRIVELRMQYAGTRRPTRKVSSFSHPAQKPERNDATRTSRVKATAS